MVLDLTGFRTKPSFRETECRGSENHFHGACFSTACSYTRAFNHAYLVMRSAVLVVDAKGAYTDAYLKKTPESSTFTAPYSYTVIDRSLHAHLHPLHCITIDLAIGMQPAASQTTVDMAGLRRLMTIWLTHSGE